MLRIVINNKDLVLSNDISIQLKYISPIFSVSSFSEASSYSFDLPMNDKNIQILKSAERIDTSSFEKTYECKIYHSGFLFIEGILSIDLGVSAKVAKANIVSNSLFLAKRLEELNIRDVPMETITVVSDPNDTPGTKMATWQAYLNSKFNSDDPLECTHSFPPFEVLNSVAYEEPGPLDRQMVNWYSDQAYQIETAITEVVYTDVPYTTMIPVVKMLYVLNEVIKYLGQSNGVIGKFTEIEDIKQLSMVVNVALDNFILSGGAWYNTFADSYSLNNHIPNTDALSLFQDMRNIFATIPYLKYSSVEMISIKDLINQIPVDLTKYANPNYTKSSNQDKGFQLIWKWTKTEEKIFNFIFSGSHTRTYPSEKIEKEPKGFKIENKYKPSEDKHGLMEFSYLPIGTGNVSSGNGSILSIVDDNFKFISMVNKNENDDPIDYAILTFYRGERFGTDGKRYPLSSFLSVLPDGQKVGNLSLDWEGPNGLYQNFWKDYIDFINGKKDIEKSLNLPVNIINQMIQFIKVVYTIKNNKGNMRGIIKELSFTLTNDKISPVTALFVAK